MKLEKLEPCVTTAEMARAVGMSPRSFQLAVAHNEIEPCGELLSAQRRFSLWRLSRLQGLRAELTPTKGK
ncbi:MAG: hypothetical protein C5B50_21565 [Verrucomicrobia bacterium]|nr:MAG: hypothetical protein C5B50_21565 [Verrucomicrobiota bacterium]